MFGLGMVTKENFLAYSTKFGFVIIRLVAGNVAMVATHMYGKSSITGVWIWEVHESMCISMFQFFLL